MDEDKKTEIEGLVEEVRTLKENLETEKAQLDEQKRALEASKIEKPENGETKMNEWRSIADAMIEKRAITLGDSNVGRVAVINELFKEMVAKKPLLGSVRKFVGPNAQTNIPVLSPSIAVPAGKAEGATGVEGDDKAKLGGKSLTPYAYVSVLPVTAEALQFGGVDVEGELPAIFAEAFADAAQSGMIKGDGASQNMKGIFAKGGTAVSCGAAGTPKMADLVKLALTIADKSDNAVIVMNPTIYAGITADASEDHKVYKEELIRNKTVEGVKVILTSYAPNATASTNIAAVALDLNNYAYGVAADMSIEPLKKVGDTHTYFQATMWMNGTPIVDKDVYQLTCK